jgi:hypothetical protein
MRTEVTAALIRQWREEISRQPVVEERPVASQPN